MPQEDIHQMTNAELKTNLGFYEVVNQPIAELFRAELKERKVI